jgi:hypothetical protein
MHGVVGRSAALTSTENAPSTRCMLLMVAINGVAPISL